MLISWVLLVSRKVISLWTHSWIFKSVHNGHILFILVDPINWPLIGVIGGLFFLATLALSCCFCWHYLWFVILKHHHFSFYFFNSFLSPFATRGSRYKRDATPTLYHIERCTDPACGWPYRTSLSDTFLSSMNSHHIHTTSNDISSNSYTKLVQLSSNTSIKTENKSDTSSTAHNRLLLSREGDKSVKRNAHVSISSIKVDNKIRTAGNPGIKPPAPEAHVQKPNILLDIENIKVSRVSCTGQSKKSSFYNKLSRNLIRPCATDQNRGSVRVTRVGFISSDVIGQTTVNVPCLLNFEDTTYSDSCVKVKTNSLRTNMIGSQQFKRLPLESTTMKINHLSKIDPSGVSSMASRS